MEILNKVSKDKIDLSIWKRRDHYNFFRKFEQPFTGISTEINCTEAYHYCKTYKVPFFMFYLYKAHIAVNHIKEFRYRIENNEVFEYQKVSGAITIIRPDETFGFAYFDDQPNFKQFLQSTRAAIDLEKDSSGLTTRAGLNGIIHYSVLPLIKFNSMQHAQMLSSEDCIPKIVFGKFDLRNSQMFLPISIHVHHALCDGLHIGRFLECFQREMEIGY